MKKLLLVVTVKLKYVKFFKKFLTENVCKSFDIEIGIFNYNLLIKQQMKR